MAAGIGVIAVALALAAIIVWPLIKFIRLWVTINKFEGPPAIPLLGNAHQLQGDPTGELIIFLKMFPNFQIQHHGY